MSTPWFPIDPIAIGLGMTIIAANNSKKLSFILILFNKLSPRNDDLFRKKKVCGDTDLGVGFPIKKVVISIR
jgi:hypothetical protein